MASKIPDGTWWLGRREFLAVAGATALGTIAAGKVLAQAPSPGATTDFPPPTAVDPIGDLAFALDADIERIFRFVADEIRYEPYAGALRGARGTLASRAGNSVDQALLLAAILEAASAPVRFASGTIDEPTAATLLATSVTPAEDARMDAVERLLGPRDAEPIPPPDPSIVERMQRPGSTPSDVEAWLARQIDGTVATLTGALAGAGVILPATFTPVPMLERDRHVWVQVSSGAGWLDLDPSLPGQASGRALATASQTTEVLPEDLWHNVELAVIAETVSAGTLVESSLLSFPGPAAAISDAPISLVNVTPEALKAVGVAIVGGLEGWKTYVPALLVGDQGYGGRPFRFTTGETLFSGGGPAPDGETTAVWLQLTVSSPEAEPVVVRRAVFDRVGDVARTGGAFVPSQLAPIELVSLGPDLPEEYAPAYKGHWLTVTTGTPTFGRFSTDAPVPDHGNVAVIAQAYQFARELSAAAMGVDRGVRTFQSGPNVAGVAIDALAGPDGLRPEGLASDIWHRSFGHSPLDDVASSVPPALLSGVVSHVAERSLHEPSAAFAGEPAHVGISVGAVFEAAATAGIALRVLTNAALPDDLALPADAALRLGRRLAEGWLAVLPERGVPLGGRERTGWWLVDPLTGETIDELDDGRGVAVPEYDTALTPAQAAFARLKLVACVAAGASALLTALGWGATAAAWFGAFESGAKGVHLVLLAAMASVCVGMGVNTFALAMICEGGPIP